MTVRKRGQGWRADVMANGTRYRHSFRTEEAAHKWEAQALEARRLGQPIPSPSPEARQSSGFTMAQVLADVASDRWAGNKSEEKSVMNARQAVEFFGESTDIRTLTKRDTTRYIQYLRDVVNNSGATINRKLSGLSQMFKYAADQDPDFRPPTLSRQKDSEFRPRIITDEEEVKILATLKLWGYPRIFDLVVFLLDTGARFGEAMKLTWTDVTGRLVRLGGKNGEYRQIPLTDRAVAAIERSRAAGAEPGPFKDLNKWHVRGVWDRLRQHLGLDDVVIHTLRHTTCSRLVSSGMDAFRVQKWMGHKNIQTTQRYVTLYPSDLDELSSVLDRRIGAVGSGQSGDNAGTNGTMKTA